MRIVTCLAWAGLLLATAFPSRAEDPARTEETVEVRLRDVEAVVREVGPPRENAEGLLEAIVVPGEGEPLRLSLAPAEVFSRAGFTLSPGDEVRVRYFTGEAPYPVQRIRNHKTGRVLRLRCLHGQPLWTGPGEGKGGPGHHGPPQDGRGGHGRGRGAGGGPPP